MAQRGKQSWRWAYLALGASSLLGIGLLGTQSAWLAGAGTGVEARADETALQTARSASAASSIARKRSTSGRSEQTGTRATNHAVARPGGSAASGVSEAIAGATRTRREVIWRRPGQCAEADDGRDAERAKYLATFKPTPVGRTTIYAHPDAPPSASLAIALQLPGVHRRTTDKLWLSADPPSKVFLYGNVEALQAHSCVGPPSVAYYDGAIHVALDKRLASHREMQERWLSKSLEHEYVHHVLISNDVFEPIWFQEGAAMMLARDSPPNFVQVARLHPIRLHEMVSARPTQGSAEEARLFYAQSYLMIEFLERLCLNRIGCGSGELVAALKSGRATPETLFDWAVSERAADLVHTSRLPLWDDYFERGDFAPATQQALLTRPRPRAN